MASACHATAAPTAIVQLHSGKGEERAELLPYRICMAGVFSSSPPPIPTRHPTDESKQAHQEWQVQVARLSPPPPPPPSRHKPSSFRAGQCHRGRRECNRRRVYYFSFSGRRTRPRRVFADVLSPYLLTFMSVVLRLATTVLASLARLGLCSGDMESLFSALALPKPNPVCRSHRAAVASPAEAARP